MLKYLLLENFMERGCGEMKKKTLLLALVMIFTMAFSSVALAFDIMPLWDKADSCLPSLSISGSNAYCSLNVEAVNASERITATVTLQKLNSNNSYGYVQSWSGLSGTGRLRFSGTGTASSSGSYRIKCDVNVGGEAITVYAYATK